MCGYVDRVQLVEKMLKSAEIDYVLVASIPQEEMVFQTMSTGESGAVLLETAMEAFLRPMVQQGTPLEDIWELFSTAVASAMANLIIEELEGCRHEMS